MKIPRVNDKLAKKKTRVRISLSKVNFSVVLITS